MIVREERRGEEKERKGELEPGQVGMQEEQDQAEEGVP